MTNQANWNIVNASLNGPNAIKTEQDLLTNPRLMDAYSAILKSDPSVYKVVNNAINVNATGMWDTPATDLTDQVYNNLNGMQYTDRDRFANLNLMQYYGGMPVDCHLVSPAAFEDMSASGKGVVGAAVRNGIRLL